MRIDRFNENEDEYFVLEKEGNKNLKGVWFYTKGKNGINKVRISTLIYIEKKIKAEGVQHYLVKWLDDDELMEKYVSASNLFSDGFKENDVFKDFIDGGLIIAPRCKNLLIEFLKSSAQIVQVEQGVSRLGWCKDLNEFYGHGFSTDLTKKFIGSSGFKFEKKGSELDYKNTVGQIFSENPLVFAICSYSASAFLLPHLRNETNQVLQLTGTSSQGKSIALKLALSLFTTPLQYKGFNNTKGSLFSIIKRNNNHPICLDEVGESTMKIEDKISFIYSLCNGEERGRTFKNDVLQDYVTTSTTDEKQKFTALVAGEKSFLDGIKREGTGIDARFIEIPLPKEIPLWDSINTSIDAENFAEFLLDNYGWCADYFINYIKENKRNLINLYNEKLSELRDEFDNSSSIVKRKIRFLSYSYVSSLILAQYFFEEDEELIFDTTNNALNAFKKAITYEIENDKATDIYKEALSHIQDTLFKYLEPKIDDGVQLNQKWGYREITATHKEILIISSKLSNVCQLLGLDERLFIMYLKENNLLVTEKEGNTKKITKNGARGHYYFIKIPHSFFEDVKALDEGLTEEDKNFLDNSSWGKD